LPGPSTAPGAKGDRCTIVAVIGEQFTLQQQSEDILWLGCQNHVQRFVGPAMIAVRDAGVSEQQP
jgi:hypothetical protein